MDYVDSFDLEQHILQCWQVTEDLLLVAEAHEDNDEVCNKVLGLKSVYEMRFNKLWDIYEKFHNQELIAKKSDILTRGTK